MPPPPRQRIRPFGVPREDDPNLLDVTTADGRALVLPRDMAEGAGVEVRQRLADLGDELLVPDGAPVDPTLARAAAERRGIPDAPMSTQPPEPWSVEPAAPRFNPSEVEVPAAPQPGAPVEAQIDAYQQGGLPAVQALNEAPPRLAPPSLAAPAIDPRAPIAPAAPPAVPLPRPQQAPSGRYVTADGRVITAEDARPEPEAEPAVRPAGTPLGTTPVEDPWATFGSIPGPRGADAPPRRDDPIVGALRDRPADAPPLAPQDFRQPSPLDRQAERIDRERGRVQAAADARQAAAIDREDVIRREAQQREEIAARRDAALASAQRNFYDAYQEARSATVNPTRLWQNGGGVAMALATAVGQLASGITGGPNTALQVLERAVERDIRAQTTNQANAQRTVSNARAFFDLTRQRFDSEEAAVAAARALAWDQIAQRLEAQTAGLESEGARDRAAQTIEQARAQAAQAAQEAERAALEWTMDRQEQEARIRQLQADATRAERRAASGGGSADGDVRRRLAGARAAQQAGMDPAASYRLFGLDPSMLAEDAGGNINEGVRDINAAMAALQDLERLIPPEGQDIPGIGAFDGNVARLIEAAGAQDIAEGFSDTFRRGQEIRGAQEQLVELIGRLHSGGAISDDEQVRFLRLVGGNSETATRRALPRVRRELEARLGNLDSFQQNELARRRTLPEGVRPR